MERKINLNYANVIYSIEPKGEGALLTISLDNIHDQPQLEHLNQNWGMVLGSIKQLLENNRIMVLQAFIPLLAVK